MCVCFLVCQDMLKNNCQCKCFSVQSIFGVPIGRATGPDVARIWWNWWLQWCNWHRENKIYAWKECGWHVSGKRECLHPVVIRLFLDICLQYVYVSLKSLRYTHMIVGERPNSVITVSTEESCTQRRSLRQPTSPAIVLLRHFDGQSSMVYFHGFQFNPYLLV